ncbi:MAG: cell division protein FtsL [Pseudomonadota bacterium]|nr:cell division protein FtsL [Pseudomonadota bacterium]
MTRRIQITGRSFNARQVEHVSTGWIERVLWLALAMSIFGLIYIKFMNRYHTIWLDQLEKKHVELVRSRESLLLEKEKLLTYDRVERVAENRLHLHMPATKEMVSVRLPYAEA